MGFLDSFDQSHHPGRDIGEDDQIRLVETSREFVRRGIVGVPDDPHGSSLERAQPAALGVGRLHTRPRLGEGGGGITQRVIDRNHIGTVVGIEDFRADQVILDQATRDGVAIGGASALYIDVGLNRQAETRRVLISEVEPGLDDGYRHLVPEPGRVVGPDPGRRAWDGHHPGGSA